MKLLTFRVKDRKHAFSWLDGLYRAVLRRDSAWHYFMDGAGVTLRMSPSSEKQVVKYLENNDYKFSKHKTYDPSLHEYSGLGFLGEDLANLFHDMSVLMIKYPMNASFYPTLERLTHGLVNMVGIHDFYKEACLYLDLAEGRLRFIKQPLRPQKIAWKVYLWLKHKILPPRPFTDGLRTSN